MTAPLVPGPPCPQPVQEPVTSSAPGWIDRGHIPALDGLRAVAVGLVVFSHAYLTDNFPAFAPVKVIVQIGEVGVDVFFVLSGFLITILLCRESDRTGRVSLRGFYTRRALRILPAYVCLLGVVALMQAGGLVAVPALDWVAAATYTMNFREHPVWELGHIWSLSIEEHFYLVWPLIFILLPRRAVLRILIGILVAEPVIRWTILLWEPNLAPTIENWTFVRIDSIACGCLLALMARTAQGRRRLDRLARFWPLALALLVAAEGMATVSGKFNVGVTPSVVAVTVAILVWLAVRREWRWLGHPGVVAVGIGSYGVYLWQELFLNPRQHEWWTAFPQNVLLVALVAFVSYRVIERPFLRLKDRTGPARSGDGFADATVKTNNRCETDPTRHLSLTRA